LAGSGVQLTTRGNLPPRFCTPAATPRGAHFNRPAARPSLGGGTGMRGLIGLIVTVVVIYLVLRFLNII
jgi:uncharacterized membrane protein